MLLDTAGIYALVDGDDVHHDRVHGHYSVARRRLTHSYVLAE